MRSRLLFILGLGAGYVIGARAGRTAYDAIVARAKGTAASPKVQDALVKAGAFAEEKAPKATSAVQQVAQTAAETADAAKQAGTDDKSEDETPSTIDEAVSSVVPDPADKPVTPTATA